MAPLGHAAPCRYLAERNIVNAAMNLDSRQVDDLVSGLDSQHALIPSAAFYRALAEWYQAYQTGAVEAKTLAIKSLRRAVSTLVDEMSDRPSGEVDLAAGVASGHLARMLFDSKQYLAGYRMAVSAREHLERFLAVADKSHPGYPDAALLQGLFEIYSHDLRRRDAWLPPAFNYEGNRRKGIALIELAIEDQAVFSSEAGRALLAEVPWRTPDFCRYLDLVSSIGARLDNNLDLFVLRQGLMLKCGYPLLALSVNDHYSSVASAVDTGFMRLVRLARLRIFASLGQPLRVTSVGGGVENEAAGSIALANAHDVAGNRDRALQIYQTLANDPHTDDVTRKVANTRIRFPFQPPAPVEIDQFTPGSHEHCS